MLTQSAYFVLGLALLVSGAEALVRGASRIARSFRISPLVVGLTIVAFGTSSPEVAVSLGAALHGNGDIAIGNVVGSNVFNVLFILGVSALITPLAVHAQVIRQEVPIMIGASVLLGVMAVDGRLGRWESTFLLAVLVVYTLFLLHQSRAQTQERCEDASATVPDDDGRVPRRGVAAALMGAGLVLLVFGSDLLVGASVEIARSLGVSDLVVGLTIIAVGTSMPEVATSIVAAARGERDIAVGNVIGSNTFNILGCLGLSGLASTSGLRIAPSVLRFDLWVMIAVAVACLPVFVADREIGRGRGLLFVAYYVAYVTYLVLGAQGHDALDEYSAVMLSFVLPITIITLVAMVLRRGSPSGTGS